MRSVIQCSIALLLISVFSALVFHLRINVTASIPIGLYRLKPASTVRRYDIVCVCLPKAIAERGLTRRYLFRGNCVNSGTVPVAKMIIALPGDRVAVCGNVIQVNEHVFFAPRHYYNRRGEAVHDQGQCMKHETQKYWLYGYGDKVNSWDSRYYGGVEQRYILGIYQPFWVKKSVEMSEESDSTFISTQAPRHDGLPFSRNYLNTHTKNESPIGLTPYFLKTKNFLTTHSQRPITWSATRGEANG